MACYAQSGVFRSADGGASWTMVLSGVPVSGGRELLVEPGQAATWYVILGSRLYRSTDTGCHWSALAGGGLPADVTYDHLAVAAADPHRLYLTTAGPTTTAYVSKDGGSTWASHPGPADAGNAIVASPTNKDEVLSGQVFLYESTNGGKSFASNLTTPVSSIP